MGKLWEGRFSKALDETADDFNSSISFDSKIKAEEKRTHSHRFRAK